MKYLLLVICFIFTGQVRSIELEFNNEVDCFAMAIYFEARSEILTAQVAVAESLLTRIKNSKHYPDSSCANITRKKWSRKHNKHVCAFEWYCAGQVTLDLRSKAERRAWNQAVLLAQKYLSSYPPSLVGLENVSLFHDVSKTPWWAKSESVRFVAQIGRLKFYEEVRNGKLITKL